jgi:uncharacterized membrane protein YuzA (DUF378 family)
MVATKGGGYVKLSTLAWWLLIIGGLNWALVGLFGKDLFVILGIGMDMWLAKLVYLLVGASALYVLFGKKMSM